MHWIGACLLVINVIVGILHSVVVFFIVFDSNVVVAMRNDRTYVSL